MTDRKKDGPSGEARRAEEAGKRETLSLEEFKRLATDAQERGEPIDPLVERLVVSTIKTVRDKLDEEDESEPSKGS